jgi:hypothetical protein
VGVLEVEMRAAVVLELHALLCKRVEDLARLYDLTDGDVEAICAILTGKGRKREGELCGLHQNSYGARKERIRSKLGLNGMGDIQSVVLQLFKPNDIFKTVQANLRAKPPEKIEPPDPGVLSKW